MIRNPRIVFMGSGIFAVPVLEALANSHDLTLAVAVTQPDRAAGRKRVMTPTPLGRYADEAGIPCERVQSVNTPEFLDHVAALEPDMIVVVSFGQILREPILNLPPLGCLNVHASLLPKYRGASPITTCVLNGDEVTGVTFMQMERGLDSGPIYEMHRMQILPGTTADELERTLSGMAGNRICDCIGRIVRGEITPHPQPEEGVTVAVKIRKSDGFVVWSEDAAVLERKVRAYHNWPSMSFRVPVRGRIMSVKITKASYTAFKAAGAAPGKITALADNRIMVSCGSGSLLLERIVPEGKKEMSVADFLNGARLEVGDMLLNGLPEPQPTT
jgi:methionyl-tRNA formyltransferase